ncbi:MAG: transketolase C-terminal domain-containing protein, partial [Clostridia bacterium]|nr:transketolase C-terminal domain-containing protein [Clostridia bacterium]
VGVLNLSCPLCPDEENIRRAAETGYIFTYEDHNVRTGIGSLIGAYLAENGIRCRFRRIGVRQYGVSAGPDDQYRAQHMHEDDLEEAIRHTLAQSGRIL